MYFLDLYDFSTNKTKKMCLEFLRNQINESYIILQASIEFALLSNLQNQELDK